VFQPGETLDLSFLVPEQQLQASKGLRLALEKGHVEYVSGAPFAPSNFRALISKIPVAVPGGSSIRRALFVDSAIPPVSISFGYYVMRDLPTRRNIVTSTKDSELLENILDNEQDTRILATAKSRLIKLRQA
jgi:hypothetical protein